MLTDLSIKVGTKTVGSGLSLLTGVPTLFIGAFFTNVILPYFQKWPKASPFADVYQDYLDYTEALFSYKQMYCGNPNVIGSHPYPKVTMKEAVRSYYISIDYNIEPVYNYPLPKTIPPCESSMMDTGANWSFPEYIYQSSLIQGSLVWNIMHNIPPEGWNSESSGPIIPQSTWDVWNKNWFDFIQPVFQKVIDYYKPKTTQNLSHARVQGISQKSFKQIDKIDNKFPLFVIGGGALALLLL